MQQLRDKLAIAERAARSEAMLKAIPHFFFLLPLLFAQIFTFSKHLSLHFQERYHMRLKVIEETVRGNSGGNNRNVLDGRSISNGPSRRQSLGGADNFSRLTASGLLSKKTSASQSKSFTSGTSTVLKHAKGTSRSFDGGTRSLDRGKILRNGTTPNYSPDQSCDATKEQEDNNFLKESSDDKSDEFRPTETEDTVPGVLYDILQKEVISLRKAGHEKDQSLKDKDDAIEVGVYLLLP